MHACVHATHPSAQQSYTCRHPGPHLTDERRLPAQRRTPLEGELRAACCSLQPVDVYPAPTPSYSLPCPRGRVQKIGVDLAAPNCPLPTRSICCNCAEIAPLPSHNPHTVTHQTGTHTQSRTHTRTCAQTNAHTHARALKRTHTRTLARTHAHTCTHACTHARTHASTHTHTHMHARTHTHTHTHTQANTHTHTRTHAHTHASTTQGWFTGRSHLSCAQSHISEVVYRAFTLELRSHTSAHPPPRSNPPCGPCTRRVTPGGSWRPPARGRHGSPRGRPASKRTAGLPQPRCTTALQQMRARAALRPASTRPQPPTSMPAKGIACLDSPYADRWRTLGSST